jgi:predicted PurR-regulated permease PerM
MLTAGVLLAMAGGIFILLGVILLRKLAVQVGSLVEALPGYESMLREWMMKVSGWGERWFHMEQSAVFDRLWGILQEGIDQVKEGAMPWVLAHSSTWLSGFVGFMTVLVLIQVAVLLCVQELDRIRSFEKNSLFAREIRLVKEPMVQVGKAYLKTELIIMGVVMGELMLGLSLMGNRYSMLFGLLIGILDAMPLFGTGTVLIPWTLVELLMGDFKKAAMVAVLYLVCYFTRQLLEPRLMGDGTGLTPLESLAAIYTGLKLWGIWGLFLGPIAWMLVKACVEAYG